MEENVEVKSDEMILKEDSVEYQGGNFDYFHLSKQNYSRFIKESGIIKKRYLDGYANVDFDYIYSDEYKLKFMSITDNQVVNERLYNCAISMLVHRDGTAMEDFNAIDYQTGEIKAKQLLNEKPDMVIYKKSTKSKIRICDDYSLITIHNHSSNNPPTGGDFSSAFNFKYRFGIVVCHNGEVYYYKVGEKLFSGTIFDKNVENYKSCGYNNYDAFEQTLNLFIENYVLEWRRL
ncbi:MAG: hypothetical protein LUG60_01990 [Erysipelotrichaceae bacterium]|nr:hypothetical protein [Erysipelotrichaceae bacterium]